MSKSNISAFIEDAIKGGWRYGAEKKVLYDPQAGCAYINKDEQYYALRDKEVLIDPEAWRAVGKVRGWHGEGCRCPKNESKEKHHRFLDALWEGKSIEEGLKYL